MKKVYILLFLFWLVLFLTSLQAQNFRWAKREGLWAYDYGYGICTDNSGNVYMAGKYEQNAKFSGVTLPCQGNHDIYLAKYSPSGSLLWIRTAGGITGDYAWAITCDNNYVYIAGEIEGTNTTIKFIGSPITLKCKGSNDIFLAKYDLNGNLIWARSAGDTGYDKALGITYDASGNLYICGIFTDKAVFGGNTTIYGYGDKDIFIAKYDRDGNFIWVKKAGGTGRDEAKSIRSDAAGNLYVCGMYRNSSNFSGQVVTAPNGKWNMFVAKYSTNGSLLWLKTAGADWDDVAWSLTMDNAGKIYVTGEFNARVNFGGISLTTSGSSDVFVACYNTSGTLQWVTKAGGRLLDRARGIGTDGNKLYITGQYGGTATFGPYQRTAVDSSDIFIACLSNTGQFNWVSTVGGKADKYEEKGFESGIAICADAASNVYASGALLDGGVFGNTSLSAYSRTDAFITRLSAGNAANKQDGDSTAQEFLSLNAEVIGKDVHLSWTATGDYEGFLVERSRDAKTFEVIGTLQRRDSSHTYTFVDDSLHNGIEGEGYYRVKQVSLGDKFVYSPAVPVIMNKWGEGFFRIYPNPAQNLLNIDISPDMADQQFYTFLYDVAGHEVSKAQTTGDKLQVDLASFPAGVYFIEIKAGEQSLLREKLVIEK